MFTKHCLVNLSVLFTVDSNHWIVTTGYIVSCALMRLEHHRFRSIRAVLDQEAAPPSSGNSDVADLLVATGCGCLRCRLYIVWLFHRLVTAVCSPSSSGRRTFHVQRSCHWAVDEKAMLHLLAAASHWRCHVGGQIYNVTFSWPNRHRWPVITAVPAATSVRTCGPH